MAIRFEGALLTPSIFNREVVLVIEPQSRRVSRIVKRVAGSLFREQRLSSMALHPLKNNRGSISTAATKHACHPRGVLPFFRGEIATVSRSIFFPTSPKFCHFFREEILVRSYNFITRMVFHLRSSCINVPFDYPIYAELVFHN